MYTLNKISLLLNEQNKSQKELTDYLGLKKGTYSSWKAGRNSSYLKYISQIATFLDVSVDYLLSEEDSIKKIHSSEVDERISSILQDKDVQKLLGIFTQLSPEQQDHLLRVAEFEVSRREKSDKE